MPQHSEFGAFSELDDDWDDVEALQELTSENTTSTVRQATLSEWTGHPIFTNKRGDEM